MTLPLQTLSDEALVRLVAEIGAEDDRPFEEIYLRHYAMVWRACYQFFQNAQDAEDVAQDTFFRAFKGIRQFEERASFKTWLYQIALNASKNELRFRARRPKVLSPSLDDLEETLQTGPINLEQQALFAEAMEGLKLNQQEVLLLREIEGHAFQEISEKLDISLSAAKMRVQRARLALKENYLHLLADQGLTR